MTNPDASVFELSGNHISHKVKAGRIWRVWARGSAPTHPGGIAHDLSTDGAEPPELMTAGRWDSPTMIAWLAH